MKLLLLGCTGFIGKELVQKLISRGHELAIVSRRKSIDLGNTFNHKNIYHLQLDPASESSWENNDFLSSLQNAQGIVNLVGEPIAERRWSKSQRDEIKNSRINTTRYLIKTLNQFKNPPQLLINGSAIGFYGTSQENLFDENSQAGDDFLAEVCNEWEHVVSKKPNSTRLVVLRIGIVLEKEGGALGKMLPIFRSGLGGPIGTGMQWMSWIHRTDLCEIIDNAISNKNWSGTFNAVSPQPISMKQFSETLGQVLHRPTILKVPAPILRLLLGDGAKVVLEGQKVISIRLKKLGFEFLYPEILGALKTL